MKVFLRALNSEDSKSIHGWRNDPEIQSQTGGNLYFVSEEAEREWVQKKMASEKDLYLAICTKDTAKMIGYLSLNAIDLRNRRAEWGGIVLDPKDRTAHGFASEAAFLMLQYAFEELGLQKVTGHWLETHKVSLMLGQMLGFKKEGVLRNHVFKGGSFRNLTVMSLLKEEYDVLKENFESA